MNQALKARLGHLTAAAEIAQREGRTVAVEPADIFLLAELVDSLRRDLGIARSLHKASAEQHARALRDVEDLTGTVDRMVAERHSEQACEPGGGRSMSEERVKAARWDRLKLWLRTVTTNGALADDTVSAMRDVVFLIEEEDRPPEPEPDPPLTGRALLDRVRAHRLAALARRGE